MTSRQKKSLGISMSTIKIPLKAVDLQDLTYVITYAPDLEPLRNSIAQVGILHPPLVQEIPPAQRFRVVSGYKRLKASEEEDVLVRVVSPQRVLPLFLLTLQENMGTRALNMVEKSLALHKLTHQFHLGRKKILEEYLPILGLGSDPKTLDLYLTISEMEDDIKTGLVTGHISISTAQGLSALPPADRLAFCRLAAALDLGKNLQREFLTLLTDISRTQKAPLEALLGDPEIRILMENTMVQAPIRAKKVRQLLIRRRYPRFSRAADEFQEVKKRAQLPPHVSLTASPFFEGQDYRIKITFRNRAQLSAAVEALQALSRDPALRDLLQFPLHRGG